MAIRRSWDIQWDKNWWISLGLHFDHTDPSLTIHTPGLIISFGRCKQPGFRNSMKMTSQDSIATIFLMAFFICLMVGLIVNSNLVVVIAISIGCVAGAWGWVTEYGD